jgi:hypothetical protein
VGRNVAGRYWLTYHGFGSSTSQQGSVLFDPLSSAFCKKKKKNTKNKDKNKEMARDFSQGRHILVAVLYQDFPNCQVQLKAVLRVNP